MPRNAASKPTPSARRSPMEHPRRRYPQETAALRKIAESCGLTEQIKWGKPCYSINDKKVVLIQGFKAYIALLFFKGALLKDPEKLLSRISEHMKGPRQLRFTSLSDITRMKPEIEALILEAIDLEKSGARVPAKTVADYKIPEELQAALDEKPALKKAFFALTPGRQRGYMFQIGGAKQSATRAARVEKYAPQILAGKGLND